MNEQIESTSTLVSTAVDLISILPGLERDMLLGTQSAELLPFVLIGLSFSIGASFAAFFALRAHNGLPGESKLADLVRRGKQKMLNPLAHVVFDEAPKDPRAVARNSIGTASIANSRPSSERTSPEEPLDLDQARRARSKFGNFGRRNREKAA